MFFEGVPGGPLDCFDGLAPDAQLAKFQELLRAYVDDPVLGSSAIKAIKHLTGAPADIHVCAQVRFSGES